MTLSIHYTKQDDWDVLSFSGDINEEAEITLDDLKTKTPKKALFNLRKVGQVNSCGVRAWINFIREAQKQSEIAFEDCVPEIVSQMNMIPNFRAQAKVNSVIGIYLCDKCDKKQEVKFIAGQNMPKSSSDEITPPKCATCGSDMEMEELEEEFFSWVDSL